jgi:putative transposase
MPISPRNGPCDVLHIFGAYRWEDDTVAWTSTNRRNSLAFITFLEHLFTERYPTGCFILVLDNASIHKSAASLAALSLFEHRVKVIWLPPYCSTLNPIERFWRYLKDRVCINKLFPDLDELCQAVEDQLSFQNDCQGANRFSFSKVIQ